MGDVIIVYKNSKGVHLHTWEATLPISSEDINEAVYCTGLVENDDVQYTIELK